MKSYIYIFCRERYTIIYYIWYTGASWDTSRVRAQCLPLFLRGGWGGQLGLLGGAAPIVFQLLIQECHFSYSPKESESEWHSRAKDRSADHHFQKEKENSLQLECPDANGPGLLRAGPSGEDAHDAGTYVPCSDRVNPHVSQESKRRPVTHCQQFQKLLGLMSAASNVIPFGLLYMRPLQWWRKTKGFSPRGNPLRMIKVTRRCLRALDMWRKPLVFVSRPGAGSSCRWVTLATDASLTGWGAVMGDQPGPWFTRPERSPFVVRYLV